MCSTCPHEDNYHNCSPACHEHPEHDPEHVKPPKVNAAEQMLDRADLDVSERFTDFDHDREGNVEWAVLGLRSTLIECTRAIVAAIQENTHDRPR